jgi:folate-dependent phosphoribosylglycinamide formyltransferase PurN
MNRKPGHETLSLKMVRMRIAIITTDSFFSYLLISSIIKLRPNDVVSIIVTPSKVKGKGVFGSAFQVYKKTGWQNFSYKIVAGLWVYFAEILYKMGLLHHCVTPSNVAERYGINSYYSRDCNDEPTIAYLRKENIDVLLSINVYQRMHEPLLSMPKIAAINNHFGLLPKYRGMAPYIWAMANGEKEIGLSVHHMVLQFDKGRIIRQERMPLEPGDSAMGVYLRGCLIARKMIVEAVSEVEKNPRAGFEQTDEGSYFSMPTRQCIHDLKRRGYKLWKIKDLIAVLNNNFGGEPLV